MYVLKNKYFKFVLGIMSVMFILPIGVYVFEAINGLGKLVGTYIRILGTL